MNDSKVGSNVYLHGTSAISSICIWQEGFRVLDEKLRRWKKGCLGEGIYVTKNLNQASLFGYMHASDTPYFLDVELTAGTKIARIEEEPDKKMIDSLRREFGNQILTKQFSKAIPKNKHLKPMELFALISHFEKNQLFVSDGVEKQVKRWMIRLGYHGYGHLSNDLGVVLFDPARLQLNDIKDEQTAKSCLVEPMRGSLIRAVSYTHLTLPTKA